MIPKPGDFWLSPFESRRLQPHPVPFDSHSWWRWQWQLPGFCFARDGMVTKNDKKKSAKVTSKEVCSSRKSESSPTTKVILKRIDHVKKTSFSGWNSWWDVQQADGFQPHQLPSHQSHRMLALPGSVLSINYGHDHKNHEDFKQVDHHDNCEWHV